MPPKPIKRVEAYDPNWEEELEKKKPKLQKFKVIEGAEGYPQEMWGKDIVLNMNRLTDDMKEDIEAGRIVPEEFDTAIMAVAQAATANLELTVPDPDTNAVLIGRGDLGLFVKEVMIGLAESSLLWSGPVVKLYHRVVKVPSRKIREEFREGYSDLLKMLVLKVTWFEPSVVPTDMEELQAADPAALLDAEEIFFTCGVIVNPCWQVADGMAHISQTDAELVMDEFCEYDEEDDSYEYGDRYDDEVAKISDETLDLLVNTLISQGIAVLEDTVSNVRISVPAIPKVDLEEIDEAMQLSVPDQYGSKVIVLTEA